MPPQGRLEELPPAPPADVLFDNGPLTTCGGCGTGGAGESRLRDLTSSRKTLGFGHQTAGAGHRVADDFTVADPSGWTLRQIRLFAYQTGSTTRSSLTNVHLKIWSGPPGSADSRIVFDGGTGNRLTSSSWTNLYRVSESSSGATNRPIMENVVAIHTALGPGTYWLDWQTSGRLSSGPWAPSLDGGNALQSLDGGATWQPALDSGLGEQVGFPFVIEGDPGQAVSGPAIHLSKTVGIPPSAEDFCADTDAVTVDPGTEVSYCYWASNTGDRPLSLHSVDDDQLGALLNDAELPLLPSGAVWFATRATIHATTTNTATWTASNPGPIDVVSDQDSATVYVSSGRRLRCNGAPVTFDPGIPSDWTVVNRIALGPIQWDTVTACGEAANYADTGGAACASSDLQGGGRGVYDTELITSSFSLAGADTATLSYRANYQNQANEDFLQVDISNDNGASWTTLSSWNEDHGTFRALPGQQVTLDLTPYAGQAHLLLRWHYFDPVGPVGSKDLYAQIDSVSLNCTFPPGGFHACRQPNAPIPDFSQGRLEDHLELDSSLGTIADLDVLLRVRHNWVGDLRARLKHESSSNLQWLFYRPGNPPGSCGGDDIQAVLDDEGTDGYFPSTCLPSRPAIRGALVPELLFSALDGWPAAGRWTLFFNDDASGITGTLEEWCLIGIACGNSLRNRLFLFSIETIKDCGTLIVGPDVRVSEFADLTLWGATGVRFDDNVVIEGDLQVGIDPSLAPP